MDYLGWRQKFGVTTPSTNAVVQPEYDSMRPPGVTNHLARMHISNIQTRDDDSFSRSIEMIDAGLEGAVERVMTCDPGHLVLGISALAVWGGSLASCAALTERMQKLAGRPIGTTHAVDAVLRALELHDAGRRIAILTPYYPVIEPRMEAIFGEAGYRIMRFHHMRGASPLQYTHVTDRDMIAGLRQVDGADVDVIVQFGANLPMARLADEAERWLDKPVISINVATYWAALRAVGIDDRLYGFTRLFSRF